MNAKPASRKRRAAGYALLMVLIISVASIVILSGTLRRTYTVAKMNDRNNQFVLCQNAAEAAVDKVFAKMSHDFSTPGLGLMYISNNLDTIYRVAYPKSTEDPFWTNFVFMDATGTPNKISVFRLTDNYGGDLPSQFNDPISGAPLRTTNAPVYRIIANVALAGGNNLGSGRAAMTNAVQEDIMLALVPIGNEAIFFNGLMEYTWCATFTINGHVHANSSVYVGSSANLTFNGPVTCTGVITNRPWAGHVQSEYTGSVTYNGSPAKITNAPIIALALNMTNAHSIIDIPSGGNPCTSDSTLLINQAGVVLLVSNATVTAILQSGYPVPGVDAGRVIMSTNTTAAAISNMFPFLTLPVVTNDTVVGGNTYHWSTNNFYDQRESKTVVMSQIDIGAYRSWLTNNYTVTNKFHLNTGPYPTILYVADNRTVSGSQFTAVRLTNSLILPSNGGQGFSVATPNPLYVLGNYNCPNTNYLATTNTVAAGTLPAALFSDALTVLSSSWKDNQSSLTYTGRDPSVTTINGAILSGLVYSTASDSTHFSGGVMNLPRLLEDWQGAAGSGTNLWLNTSLINLYASSNVTAQFQMPGAYYSAPRRSFAFDLKFFDPANQPPGMPCALMPVRFNFCVVPPLTTTYNVTP